MKQLSKTPTIGQQLVYVGSGCRLPCEVVSVSAAVCKVKVLSGGLDNSLAGKILNAHVALLRTA